MIFITGDTHIPIDIYKLSMANFPEQKRLSRNDTLIICGDFGGVWDQSKEDEYWLDWLEKKTFTVIFVDGNHENFQLLNNYPVEEEFGGKVHRIRENVLHVLRGEVITLEGKKFFCMGGASSHDKQFRTEGKDWWPEEMPCQAEYVSAVSNLKKNNWKVDYVITHCAPKDTQKKIAEHYKHDNLNSFLQYIVDDDLEYKHWFFGHYHIDEKIDDNHTAVYQNIIPL